MSVTPLPTTLAPAATPGARSPALHAALAEAGRGARGKLRAIRFVGGMLVQRGALAPARDRPPAVLDVSRLWCAPENWFGRLTHALMLLLHAEGYSLYLRPHARLMASFRSQKYARHALGLEPRVLLGPLWTAGRGLYVHDRPRTLRRRGMRTLRLEYDASAWRPGDAAEIAMPFLMHPLIYDTPSYLRLEDLRRRPRDVRLFFAGNVAELYDKPELGRDYRKLTRARMLRHVQEALPPDRIAVPESAEALEEMLARGRFDGFMWFGRGGARIEPGDWLPTLSRCDFFLGCPGVTKPMSHNTAEAMAVGCIPVLEYPEYFHPPLEHLSNCIAFRGADDLVAKLRDVMAMGEAVIAALRRGAIEYYKRHLTPGGFRGRLEAAGEAATLHVLAQTCPES